MSTRRPSQIFIIESQHGLEISSSRWPRRGLACVVTPGDTTNGSSLSSQACMHPSILMMHIGDYRRGWPQCIPLANRRNGASKQEIVLKSHCFIDWPSSLAGPVNGAEIPNRISLSVIPRTVRAGSFVPPIAARRAGASLPDCTTVGVIGRLASRPWLTTRL